MSEENSQRNTPEREQGQRLIPAQRASLSKIDALLEDLVKNAKLAKANRFKK